MYKDLPCSSCSLLSLCCSCSPPLFPICAFSFFPFSRFFFVTFSIFRFFEQKFSEIRALRKSLRSPLFFYKKKRKKQFFVILARRISSCFPSKHGHSAQTRCHKKRVLERSESHRVIGNHIVWRDKSFLQKTGNLTLF